MDAAKKFLLTDGRQYSDWAPPTAEEERQFKREMMNEPSPPKQPDGAQVHVDPGSDEGDQTAIQTLLFQKVEPAHDLSFATDEVMISVDHEGNVSVMQGEEKDVVRALDILIQTSYEEGDGLNGYQGVLKCLRELEHLRALGKIKRHRESDARPVRPRRHVIISSQSRILNDEQQIEKRDE